MDLIKLLAFLLSENCFFDNFLFLIEKHEDLFFKEKEEFNAFKEVQDIHHFSDNKENYSFALKTCLENNLEDLGM